LNRSGLHAVKGHDTWAISRPKEMTVNHHTECHTTTKFSWARIVGLVTILMWIDWSVANGGGNLKMLFFFSLLLQAAHLQRVTTLTMYHGLKVYRHIAGD